MAGNPRLRQHGRDKMHHRRSRWREKFLSRAPTLCHSDRSGICVSKFSWTQIFDQLYKSCMGSCFSSKDDLKSSLQRSLTWSWLGNAHKGKNETKYAKIKPVAKLTAFNLGPQIWIPPVNRVLGVQEVLDRVAFKNAVVWCSSGISKRLVRQKLELHCFPMKRITVIKDRDKRPQKLKNVTLVLHYDPPNSLKQYIHRQTGHGMVKPTSFVFIQEGSALFRELKARKIDVDELNWFDLY